MFSQITGDFWPIFFGSIILASTAPFGFSAIGVIVTNWFPENQSSTANSLIELGDVVGLTVTFGIQEVLCKRWGFFRQGASNLDVK